VQHEGEPFGRVEGVEHDQQGQPDGVGQHRLALGIVVGFERAGRLQRRLRARTPRAQHVQADAADDGGQPGGQVVDVVGVGPAQPQPRLLHGVVGLGSRAEHPVRHRREPGPVGLEALGENFLISHRVRS
jgi:hypothetical protein